MECNFENCPNFERLGKKFADRISELEQENAELKAYKDVNEDFKTAWEELKAENNQLKEDIQDIAKLLDIDVDDELNYGFIEFEVKELKAENERLKEEVETRDNLVEHFRKEAINWSKISNDCIKDIENYKQTLQEIKKYLNTLSGIDNDFVNTETYLRIIDLITKAEEE